MSDRPFNQGDWIVHLIHGVGQVTGVEKKTLAGDEKRYYRVKTADSSFWVPVRMVDSSRVRRLATRGKIRQALQILRESPARMVSNYKVRRKRIREDVLDGDLLSDVELIRDLTARKHQKGLNDGDLAALERLKKRFIAEWAVSLDIEPQEALIELERLLRDCRVKAG